MKHEITIAGSRFLLNGAPFPFTGISFFNAIYNPTFNGSSEARHQWLEKFGRYGLNVLRVWCQWDNKRGFADGGSQSTMYEPNGRLRMAPLNTLKAILTDADQLGFVIELCLFSQESWHDDIRLDETAAHGAVAALTEELKPYRNLVFQIWNEFSERTLLHLQTIKAIDAKRLVTSSPGGAGTLGDDEQNQALDFLTPHTSRQNRGRHWEIAPPEVAGLLKKFLKPVVDDEPARNGTPQYGGPKAATLPYDHILQIWQMWQLGAYTIYHHDMFQTGYGSPACPPSGIPDPEFNPYHKQVLEFIAQRERYRLSNKL